jgi:N-acetylglucosamine kinase-like BadF-type ATPase
MTETRGFYLGVDIGGTKTVYALADREGAVLRVLHGEGANHELCGAARMEEILSAGVRRITGEVGIREGDLRFIYYGAAGADTDADYRLLRGILRRVTPDTDFDFENDGFVALKSGTVDGVGMVVTCGTGNINCGVNSRGKTLKMGGLAFYGGDALGAHHIAGETFRAALRSKDRRGHPSILENLLPDALGADRVEDISEIERSPAIARTAVETLFEAARLGDGVALALTWDLVKETLDIVDVFFHTLFSHQESFKLVFEGSVFKHGYPALRTMLDHAIRQRYPAEIIVPEWHPVVGALFFAFEKSGVELSRDLADTVIGTFMERTAAS